MRLSAPGIWSVAFTLLGLPLASTAAGGAAAEAGQNVTTKNLPRRTVAQFDAGTWIENIAVRSSGALLLTSLMPNASLYEVPDPTSESATVTRLFTIEDASGLLGISEISTDVFAIAGGNVGSSGGVEGSMRVWTVDFSSSASPQPQLAMTIPEAILLNGMTTVPNKDKVVLISDSAKGVVWRADIGANKSEIAIQVPEMGSQNQKQPIGVNGIHIRDGNLTWLNHDTFKMFSIHITEDGLQAPEAKAAEVASFPVTALDDFIFGPAEQATAWVTTNSDNRVFALEASGESVVVAGANNLPDVATATACQFGRSEKDGKVLYVTTGGDEIEGKHGGKVEALDTTSFGV
ncbi:hypothetical protein L249_0463 [Ophiocordyceps polyrhachis-furcata BCC 54312]|uniref:SMP-30/Gluconolactonase/LRE-like region domain-containing protein n=1 Tax=Ophiocordyceps polyrhachis-furcata BCC 54312 TaxID=1330021 RepID=A0A367LF08_9HYPO|nr:hypothetical protein L249_0463 [Ophiocordyceps polyrhachis-furcata BCC 54312]